MMRTSGKSSFKFGMAIERERCDVHFFTCGGVETLQAPIARQDAPQSAAQATVESPDTSGHPEPAVRRAVRGRACQRRPVTVGTGRLPRAAAAIASVLGQGRAAF